MTTPPTPHPEQAQVEALPNVVATSPERIYLVIGEDCPPDAAFRECEEVTWCEDQIDANSIEYVRADVVAALRPQAAPAEQPEAATIRNSRTVAAEPVAAPVQPLVDAQLLRDAAALLESEARVDQLDHDHPPEPVTQWDYEALQVAGALRYAADNLATPPVSVERARWLTEQDRADLERIEELFSDGEGWDLPKVRMQRLAELGVIRRTGGNYYAITSFGMHCLGREDFSLPLRTFAEVVEAAETAHHAALAQAGDKEQQP